MADVKFISHPDRLKVLLALAALFLAAAPAQTVAPPEAAAEPIFQRIDEITAGLAEITGLAVERKVDYALIDREHLKEFLEQRVKEEIEPEEIRIEELLLKKFGFVPRDFDLKGTMIDLYTEQAAAFYDFRKQRLFLLNSGDDAMQEAALTHELAHALADQHFKLEKFLDAAGKNDDGALARMAVMEGQATWLMSESMVRKMGQTLVNSPETVRLMSRMIGASGGEFPIFDNAPLYMRESMLFPYTSGMQFQQAVVERLGKEAFPEVFRNPPSTTQEVLHPEHYFVRRDVERPKLAHLRHERGFRNLAEGDVGEFDYAVLLRQFATDDDVRRIAPAWRAGRYRLLEDKKDGRTVLLQTSVWESDEVARAFFEFYRKALKGKWDDMSVERENADFLQGTGDDGHFEVRLAGKAVYSVEGLRTGGEIGKWPKRRVR